MQKHTSTIVVAQRPLLREGVASLLHSSGYKVITAVSRASEAENALTTIRGRSLVILGVTGSNCDYGELAANIGLFRSLAPDIKIVVVAETGGPIDMQRIMSLASDGYILNLGSREILLKALELTLMDQKIFVLGEQAVPSAASDADSSRQRGVTGGCSPNDVRATSLGASESHSPSLSPRELEVLVCLSRGDSNKKIARSCNMAESTVKVHLKTILRKLDAHNRTQAAISAIARGLVNGGSADAFLLPSVGFPDSSPKVNFDAVACESSGRVDGNQAAI